MKISLVQLEMEEDEEEEDIAAVDGWKSDRMDRDHLGRGTNGSQSEDSHQRYEEEEDDDNDDDDENDDDMR